MSKYTMTHWWMSYYKGNNSISRGYIMVCWNKISCLMISYGGSKYIPNPKRIKLPCCLMIFICWLLMMSGRGSMKFGISKNHQKIKLFMVVTRLIKYEWQKVSSSKNYPTWMMTSRSIWQQVMKHKMHPNLTLTKSLI